MFVNSSLACSRPFSISPALSRLLSPAIRRNSSLASSHLLSVAPAPSPALACCSSRPGACWNPRVGGRSQ